MRGACTFALTFASGALGYALPDFGGRLTLLILPSGLAVGAVYRWGRPMVPAVLLAGFAIDLWHRQPLIASIGVGVGLASSALAVTELLARSSFDPLFRRARDVPLFIGATALGMLPAPLFGYLGLILAGVSHGAGDPLNWLRWWSNTTAGVLMLAPLFFGASARSFTSLQESWRAGVIWALALAGCCVAIFVAPEGQLARPPLFLFSLLLTTFGSIYFGLVVAALGALVICLCCAGCIVFSHGAFAQLTTLQGLLMIWTVSGALTGSNLIITALLAERDAAARARARADWRYAQVFDGSPQPIWVHDLATRSFLMVNEATCRQYGWSREEMLAMKVDALLPPEVAQMLAGDAPVPGDQGARDEPLETQHVTRDGRTLDVEMWSRVIDCGGRTSVLVFAVDVTERRAFGQALLEAVATEQRRIGQEVHDGLGQELTGLALTARALANRAARERDAIAPELDELALLATGCIQEARLIVQGLSPLSDADGSLEAALATLARRGSLSGTPVRFHSRISQPMELDLKVRNHLYRIAQEAVQNALKHAGAHAIDITLESTDGTIQLEVLDDGRGRADDAPAGLGMRTMRFRSSAIGARLTRGHHPGGGYVIRCELPRSRRWPSARAL
ncbi:MAG TPA: PAS domain S-box protein [Steroidobacteraceae bacterium]|nr:PAS domain S-box protein [Steroidobacteraceae bacterium]